MLPVTVTGNVSAEPHTAAASSEDAIAASKTHAAQY